MPEEPLPWQYSFLGFMWFGAAVMSGLLWLAWSPGWFPADIRAQIRMVCFGYLGIAVVLTPILYLAGRPRS